MHINSQKKYQTNLWKYFIYSFTQRRNFLSILAIYFLTLPNTNVQQIGIYAALGILVGLLSEMPSGYFSDMFGHKNALVISKIFMLLSSLCFIFSNGFFIFTLGSIGISLGWAFSSGASTAFIHETLVKLKRDNEYTTIMSKISANVSLLSVPFIIILPFFTRINMVLPIVIWAFIDVIGLLAIISTINPNICINELAENKRKSVFTILKEVKINYFIPISIFVGTISALMIVASQYKEVYLITLNFSAAYVGMIMGLTRLVWFLVGHKIHWIEKYLTLKQHLFIEIFIFSGSLFLIAFSQNIYVISAIFILSMGYLFGRKDLIDDYFLKYYIKDQNYKATLLSFKSQITAILNMAIAFAIGFVMANSYVLGYYSLALISLIILSISYYFIWRNRIE
jgi:MFS family permease